LSTVTVPGAAAKMANSPFAQGPFTAPVTLVQLLFPAELCQVPVPPSTTPLFLFAAAPPSQ